MRGVDCARLTRSPSQISDFAWNGNDDWVVASVAEDNVLQIWQMAESIYRPEGALEA